MNFQRLAGTFPTENKQVQRMEVSIVIENATGQINVTDILLQGGELSTLWTGHPSEIEWTFNA